MGNTDSIEVTIKEAAHEDAGRGIGRLSMDTMKALGEGDFLD